MNEFFGTIVNFEKRQKFNPTQEEIEIALKKFRKNGGVINKLPDTKTPLRTKIDVKFGSIYEYPLIDAEGHGW